MARIVLNTFGSFGDLHPYLAIAIELRRRGHDPIVATSEVYRAKVQAEGLGFAPVRPDVGELLHQPEKIAKLWHPRRGTVFLIRDYLMPCVEQSYADLLEAASGADLIITHSAAYAGPTVAEALRLPWISIVLQPSMFLSRYDPPILPETWLRAIYPLGPAARAAAFAMGKAWARTWAKPLLHLRRRLGLSTKSNPVFEGQLSPLATLALFSSRFAPPQPDWPGNVNVTGFVFYDRLGAGFESSSGEADLLRFLQAGPPPVLFTLGSSAVTHPGEFYRESACAAQRLGCRAILLAGTAGRDALPDAPQSIFTADYLPYSSVMPQCAAIVHQGGIGTTAQALRAGRPMLVVPWSHDQPDNAERIRRLGIARVISRARYNAQRAEREIRILLEDKRYEDRARQIAEEIANEDGLKNACDCVEKILKAP
ncbi:MAG TPA: glycosyltransferase [Bryobacteraceae bacterium]|jgi:UDP:flavonoid glycosyltransferase YjiC (YdhE family)|nr:glycosyltransferase [Bryobacteraceae bacterium]